MARQSDPADLALHGVRILGFPASGRIAGRYGLAAVAVEEHLLDHEARGWVRQRSFAGSSGWSLTDAGRAENERRLAAELDQAGLRAAVTSVHAAFLPLNDQLGAACTRWQLRPSRADPMALNDHTDWRWDDRVLRELDSLGRPLRRVCDELAGYLARFGGYAGLYTTALDRALSGQRAWVDAPDRDSCHLLLIQLHEDLLATLGLPRGPGA
jgi:hypothetical protein